MRKFESAVANFTTKKKKLDVLSFNAKEKVGINSCGEL